MVSPDRPEQADREASGSAAADALTFGAVRSTKRHLRPARFRISGAAVNSRNESPLGGSSSEEGWAQEGCLDSRHLHGGRGSPTMAFSPFKFLQEVRSETAKVIWPTRRETVVTTIMVFVMVAFASLFFFVADIIIRFAVTTLLGIH